MHATLTYPTQLGGRLFTRGNVRGYRFGFNGQMKDNEVYGEGNSYTAEYWQYDPRLGRRWNIDPVDQVSISNYACFYNSPINIVDIKGDKGTDWVKGSNGTIYWDDKVTSKENTKAGEEYLGKTYSFNGVNKNTQDVLYSVHLLNDGGVLYNDKSTNKTKYYANGSGSGITPGGTAIDNKSRTSGNPTRTTNSFSIKDLWECNATRALTGDAININIGGSFGFKAGGEGSMQITMPIHGPHTGEVFIGGDWGFGLSTADITFGISTSRTNVFGPVSSINRDNLGGERVNLSTSSSYEFVSATANVSVGVNPRRGYVPTSVTVGSGIGLSLETPNDIDGKFTFGKTVLDR